MKNSSTIDIEHLQLIEQEENYWELILERLIELVRVFGMQNMSLRGTCEELYTHNNGNFLKFIEYLALFDPLMSEHLRKVKNKETHVDYLGKYIQNELIQLLSNTIQQQILTSVRAEKYFSIILDCTPAVSHVEQMTIIVRFVDIPTESINCEGDSVYIRENYLGIVPLHETPGA